MRSELENSSTLISEPAGSLSQAPHLRLPLWCLRPLGASNIIQLGHPKPGLGFSQALLPVSFLQGALEPPICEIDQISWKLEVLHQCGCPRFPRQAQAPGAQPGKSIASTGQCGIYFMGLYKIRWTEWYRHISLGDSHSCQTQDELRTLQHQKSTTSPWAWRGLGRYATALTHLYSIHGAAFSLQYPRAMGHPSSPTSSTPPHPTPLPQIPCFISGSPLGVADISSKGFRDHCSILPIGFSYRCPLLILMDISPGWS